MVSDPILLEKIEALRKLIDERDRLYAERDNARSKAVDAAFLAASEQVKAAFEASENAINKADVNAEKWRANANEWRAAMVDRENKFASRVEMDGRLEALRVEIAGLKESRSTEHGRDTGKHDLWGYIVGGIGLILTIGAIIALGVSAWK